MPFVDAVSGDIVTNGSKEIVTAGVKSMGHSAITKQEPFESAGVGNFREVVATFHQGVAEGAYPGAVLLLARNNSIAFQEATGCRTIENQNDVEPVPMNLNTIFDVGALTNIVVTTTILMKLVEEGKVKLEDRVSRYIHGFGVFGKSPITVGQVLSHSAGLPAWLPFYEELLKQNAGLRMGIMTSKGAREMVHNSINRCQLKSAPGTRPMYSDIGFILLGHLIEVLTGMSLEKAVYQMVSSPLGLQSTSYIDLALLRRKAIVPVAEMIAPTEECHWRKKLLCGEVQDDNAWAMGGIAGHNGIFSCISDLHKFAAEMIRAYRGESSYLKASTVKTFWKMSEPASGRMVYGWDVPGKDNGLIECNFSRRAIGHNSSTGCSLWIEPSEGLILILLSNASHPSRGNKKIRTLRPQLFDLAMRALRKEYGLQQN